MSASPRPGATALAPVLALVLAACAAQPAFTGGARPSGGTPAPTAALTDRWAPGSLAIGPDGVLYATDCVLGRIFAIDADGIVTIFAGSGVSSTSGAIPEEGIDARDADIHCPAGIGFDSGGRLVIVDHASNRIRAIGADGTITTIAGGGPPGTAINDGDLAGDGGPALEATLQEPVGIAFDLTGALLFTDRDNHAVRRIAADGTISTVSGTGEPGFSGDGGPAMAAQLERPQDVAVAADGTLYIADAVNNRIRRVAPDGTITTFAGTGAAGYSGDGGPATEAELANPVEIVIAPDGSVVFSSDDNHAVRRIDAHGIITSIAGDGAPGDRGDGGPAVDAQLQFPTGLVFDAAGNLYIGDSGNRRIRMVDVDGVISTYAPRRP